MRFAYGQISKNWLFIRKFELNLVALPKKEKIRAITARILINIQLYGLMSARFHTFIIRFRLTTPLSQAPLLGQDELTRRKRNLDTRGLSVRLHTFHNRVPARIPPIASKDSLDETNSSSVAQSLRTGS